MDILAGMLAYLAGIGAIFAGLALSFSVFFSAPNQPPQPQAATAMIVKTTPPSKAAAETKNAKRTTAHHEKQLDATSVAAVAPDDPRKPAISASRLRQLVQEERARHWVYQQDANFQNRFLGYAD
jgi:hypothetical protein